MTDKNTQRLGQSIGDYLEWIKSMPYQHPNAGMRYSLVLSDFLGFVRQNNIAWENINIFEIISTNTELTFIIHKKDAIRAYKSLEKLIQQ